MKRSGFPSPTVTAASYAQVIWPAVAGRVVQK